MRLEANYEGKRVVITDKSDSRNIALLEKVSSVAKNIVFSARPSRRRS